MLDYRKIKELIAKDKIEMAISALNTNFSVLN